MTIGEVLVQVPLIPAGVAIYAYFTGSRRLALAAALVGVFFLLINVSRAKAAGAAP